MKADVPYVTFSSSTPLVQSGRQVRRGKAKTWVRALSWYWGTSIGNLPVFRIVHFIVGFGAVAAVVIFWARGDIGSQLAVILALGGAVLTYATASGITQIYYSQYPGRYDLRLGEYVARRVGRLQRKDFIPRSESYGDTPAVHELLNEVSANLRLEAARASRAGVSSATVHGILVTGSKHAAKKSVLWDAMKSELNGWTCVSWPHHMDHPADLPQRLGYRVVLWVEHLSDYASPGESAALTDFIERALDLGKSVIVLASCREGKSLQAAQRYFAPLISQLRQIKASRTFTPLVQTSTQAVSGPNPSPGDQPAQNRLAVLKAMRWLKDAGALTFPYPVVRLFAQSFGFEPAPGSDWDETIAHLSHPDHEFVRTEVRADAGARIERAPRSFFERQILGRKRVGTVKVLVPMNVFNLALLDPDFERRSKSLEREVSYVIDRLKELGEIAIETLILLGDSFLSSQRGDERASSARAARCYAAAYELLEEKNLSARFHTAWAATLLGRGNAALYQAQLRQGENPDEYLKQASEYFEQLLKGADSQTALKALVAQANHGLGDVESAYAATDAAQKEKHTTSAAKYYKAALAHLPEIDLFWTETQLDLANALSAIARSGASGPIEKTTQMQYLHDAREAYASALTVYSRESAPAVWAEIQRCLADMHLLEANEQTQSAPTDMLNALGHIRGHYFAALTVPGGS